MGKNVYVVCWYFTKGFISGQFLKMRSVCPYMSEAVRVLFSSGKGVFFSQKAVDENDRVLY